MHNSPATLEKNLEIHQKGKHRVIVWLSNSTPRYKPKRPENICPHFQTDVQSSIIHYSKMWNQQTSPSAGQRIDKQNVIYPQKRVLAMKEMNYWHTL